MLQPTSPLRRPEHVLGAIKMMEEGWEAVWTVSPVPLKYHPQKQLNLYRDGLLDFYDERGSAIVCRQDLWPTYYRNGVAYVMTRDCLFTHGTMGPKSGAYIINDEQVSIDTEDDLTRAEELISGRHKNHQPEPAHSSDR